MATRPRKPAAERVISLPEETEKALVAVELHACWQHAEEIKAYANLTPRLQEMLRLIADGLSTKEIAVRLNITKKTVEYHRNRLMKKLGIRTTARLARYAVRVGAIPP